jgi:heme ABC exporter ATP-binding subunit CcmA
MQPVVHLRGAVALLGRFPALAGANLDVQRGEIVLVRGRNGAGKTTLLRVLAGLVAVSAGEAVVLGCDLRSGRRDVRTKVGLLGHGNGLYEDLTVAENVRFWGRTVGATDAEIATAMERLGVAGRLATVPVHRLSAGQRRRTALAVVAARRPELWLLDEPHAGLDAAGRDLLDALLGEAVAAGATVVFASHDLDRAVPLARRIVTMAGGLMEAPVPDAAPLTVTVPC